MPVRSSLRIVLRTGTSRASSVFAAKLMNERIVNWRIEDGKVAKCNNFLKELCAPNMRALAHALRSQRFMNDSYQVLNRRRAWTVVAIFALVTPLLFYSAFRGIKSKNNKVEDWLPASYKETQELKWFREYFRGGQFVIVSWDGCKLGDTTGQPAEEQDDPRLERLANYLLSEDLNGSKHYFESVTTGRRILDRMTSVPTELTPESAVKRLMGALVGPDGRQTCVIVTLTDAAILQLREVVGRGVHGWLRINKGEGQLQRAMRECGIDPNNAYLGGPPIQGVSIDEEGEKSLYRLAAIAAAIGLTIAWWSLRSFALTFFVFICGIWSAVASVAVVWLTGGNTDAFLLSMPSLVFVLTVSGAVHLIKYYRDSAQHEGLESAAVLAIVKGWKPTLLCSVTTAIGLLALGASDLAPIRKFGIYSASGVLLLLFSLFVFLPSALYLWPIKRLALKTNKPLFETRLDRFWERLGSWITENYAVVTASCLIVITVIGIGVSWTTSNVDIMKLFNDDSAIQQDYRWLEKNLCRLVPIEVIINFESRFHETLDAAGNKSGYSFLDRAKVTRQIQSAVETRLGPRGKDVIGKPMSAVTFLPPLPKHRSSAQSHVERSIFNTRLEQSFAELEGSGYIAREASGNELWRLSVRVAAFKDVDYAEFTKDIRDVIEPIVRRHNQSLQHQVPAKVEKPPISVVYTGVIPIVYKAQRELLDSLMEAAFWSFITITPLLILVSRGVLPGLVAMIPNSLPVLLVFGGMGWLDLSVTIGSMMSASIALGVAVDDTIHYLIWFRKKLKVYPDRKDASLAAYRVCASPTLQAALISGLGLAVFGFSNFNSTKQFGIIMLVILIAGVVAELIMLPALLASPLGKVFESNTNRTRDAVEPRS